MGTLKSALQKLIQQTQKEMQVSTGVLPPQLGTVAAVNPDGTVDVQTQSTFYAGAGNPNPDVTVGAQVLVIITQEGTVTTVPQ